MKVLLAPLDIAGQARMTALHLNKRGIFARFFDGYINYLGYQHEEGEEYALKEMPDVRQFDVFDIFFGAMNVIEGTRKFFKDVKFVHHFCGTDVRQIDIAKQHNPYAVVKSEKDNSEQIRAQLARLATLSSHCTIMDEELRPHVAPFFEHVHIVPRMVNIDHYERLASMRSPNGNKPVVVHAPTHSKVKGTEHIVKAAESLSEIEFVLAAGMRHKMAERLYANCDIIVAQLNLDSYGVLAIEGMAMGKIVITYLSDEMRATYPEDPPIVSATKENLRDVLADVASWSRQKKDAWGRRARKYAKKYHSPDVISPKLIDVYEAL